MHVIEDLVRVSSLLEVISWFFLLESDALLIFRRPLSRGVLLAEIFRVPLRDVLQGNVEGHQLFGLREGTRKVAAHQKH